MCPDDDIDEVTDDDEGEADPVELPRTKA